MSEFLTVAGIVLQLFGGAVALRGLVKTHDAWAEKSIRTIAAERAGDVRTTIIQFARRLLRRSGDVVVTPGPAELVLVAGDASASVTWGPLPSGTVDAIRELDLRLRDLQKRHDRLDHHVRDLENDQRSALNQLRSDLEQSGEEADALVRQAAIEGLIGEAVGLLLVIVGGLLQAWGGARLSRPVEIGPRYGTGFAWAGRRVAW